MMDEGSVSGESDVGPIDLSSPEERRQRRAWAWLECRDVDARTHIYSISTPAKGVGLGLNVSLSVEFNDHLPPHRGVFIDPPAKWHALV